MCFCEGPKLFVKPSQKSNRHIITNAIGHCCLAGSVNRDIKDKVLEVLYITLHYITLLHYYSVSAMVFLMLSFGSSDVVRNSVCRITELTSFLFICISVVFVSNFPVLFHSVVLLSLRGGI